MLEFLSCRKDKNIIKVFFISILIGMFAFLPYILAEKGILSICDDYNTQMIPFATALNNSLKAGNGAWEWNIGLGAQRLGGYSYYFLGSPFFWLTMIFPGHIFPYIIAPMYILKYAVAGVTSYIYLRRYTRNYLYAVVGALLYSFSGFQSINLEFYMVHDVVALFPLLLLGTDKLYEENKKEFFIISVAINCCLNYFFFFGEVVFLTVYVLFRFRGMQGKSAFWKNTWNCILCGILGMGVAGIIFVPSAIYTFGNPRVLPDIMKMLHKDSDWLGIIKGLILPADAMNSVTIVSRQNWRSANCYLPLIGLSMTMTYIAKRWDWLSRMLIFCLTISFIPVATSAFYLFTNIYYRWWYMFILIMLIATVKVLDDHEAYPLKKTTLVYGILVILFIFVFWVGNSMGIRALEIFRPKRYLLICIPAIAGCIISIWLTLQKKNIAFKYLVLVSIFCTLTTSITAHLYRLTSLEPYYWDYFKAGESLEIIDEQYRYASNNNILMYPGKANGTGTFNSTISNSVRDFEDLFGYFSISENLEPHKYEGLVEFLAGKYEVVEEEENYTQYSILEREACPIGYYYESYITQNELLELDVDKRGLAFLRNLVINDKDIDKVDNIIYHDESYKDIPAIGSVKEYTETNVSRKVNEFERIHSGFKCKTDGNTARVYFFSVPYDSGWRLYIDGQKGSIINASGFMATAIHPGEHELVFKYRSPGLILGTIISITAIAICMYFTIKKKCVSNKVRI